jgi:hypothetical protein
VFSAREASYDFVPFDMTFAPLRGELDSRGGQLS